MYIHTLKLFMNEIAMASAVGYCTRLVMLHSVRLLLATQVFYNTTCELYVVIVPTC